MSKFFIFFFKNYPQGHDVSELSESESEESDTEEWGTPGWDPHIESVLFVS